MTKRLGILGGTFDPPHKGHLMMARLAREALRLDAVLFVPCHTPPHAQRKRAHAPAWDRFAMCVLAAAGIRHAGVSAVELEAGRRMYTIETLARLRRRMPGARLFFLMGEDSLHDLPAWRRPKALVETFDLVVFPRPGAKRRPIPAYLRARMRIVPRGGLRGRLPSEPAVWMLRHPVAAVSSSAVRRALGEGKKSPPEVPRSVLRYIMHRGLYRA